QRRHQARDADGKARGWNGLAHETRDEAIVTPATADRPEDDLFSLLVGDVEGEFGFEDRASVVFEAAHDGGIDLDAVRAVTCASRQSADRVQFIDALSTLCGTSNQFAELGSAFRIILDTNEEENL